jgi:hypothetical protein
MKKIINKSGIQLIGLLIAIMSLQGCYSTGSISGDNNIAPPPWAPSYGDVSEVHYYYLPDLEIYYDVWNHEYVYLQDGNWIYSSMLPPYYSSYDINNTFVVALDARVHQPWMHHQLYASHYPRYYYRTDHNRYYDPHRNGRFFNENSGRGATSRPAANASSRTHPEESHPAVVPAERNQTRTDHTQPGRNENEQNHDGRNNNNPAVNGNPNHQEPSSRPAAVQPENRENNPQHNDNGAQKSQPAVYRGRHVGQPVKVRRNMTEPKSPREKNSQPSDRR